MEQTLEERIARFAHATQVDKAGAPYILHVERVVARVVDIDPAAAAVAWLHDVVEDTPFTIEFLRAFGCTALVQYGVEVLTKRPPYDYEAYILGISKAPLGASGGFAREVKIADLQDHLENPGCPETLRPRYQKALALLLDAQGKKP